VSTSPPIISFVAPSGTGKTTYLVQLIAVLAQRGVRIAAIKHDAHRFQMDHPGKDTYRLREAGAVRVAISNDREMAVIGEAGPDSTLRGLIEHHIGPVDLVVVEGYREADVLHVIVARHDAPHPPHSIDPDTVVAVVGDVTLPLAAPHLPLDDPTPLADLLMERFGL
jgi:molybdopterin-guanine dinucleotide biosynthesis protein MobB